VYKGEPHQRRKRGRGFRKDRFQRRKGNSLESEKSGEKGRDYARRAEGAKKIYDQTPPPIEQIASEPVVRRWGGKGDPRQSGYCGNEGWGRKNGEKRIQKRIPADRISSYALKDGLVGEWERQRSSAERIIRGKIYTEGLGESRKTIGQVQEEVGSGGLHEGAETKREGKVREEGVGGEKRGRVEEMRGRKGDRGPRGREGGEMGKWGVEEERREGKRRSGDSCRRFF